METLAPSGSRQGRKIAKKPALLPPCTTGIFWIRSNLGMALGRVIGGWAMASCRSKLARRAADTHQGAREASAYSSAQLCWRIDSQESARDL